MVYTSIFLEEMRKIIKNLCPNSGFPDGWTDGLWRRVCCVLGPSCEALWMLIAPLTGQFHPASPYKQLLEASTTTTPSDLNFKLPFFFHSRFRFKRLKSSHSPYCCIECTVKSDYIFCLIIIFEFAWFSTCCSLIVRVLLKTAFPLFPTVTIIESSVLCLTHAIPAWLKFVSQPADRRFLTLGSQNPFFLRN
jgi:hypothetical protein